MFSASALRAVPQQNSRLAPASDVTRTDYEEQTLSSESYLKAAQSVLHEQEVVGRGVLRAVECAQRLMRAVEPLEQQLDALEQLLQLLHAELRALPARTRVRVHLYLYMYL